LDRFSNKSAWFQFIFPIRHQFAEWNSERAADARHRGEAGRIDEHFKDVFISAHKPFYHL
jgi:hypothetical protein